MSAQMLFTTLFIAVGAVLMALAIMGTRRLMTLLEDTTYYRFWWRLVMFMGLFLVGYVVAIGLVIADMQSVLVLLTGIIFMFGALFVFLVSRLGFLTIEDVNQLRQQLKGQVNELSALQASLEEKNAVLEHQLALGQRTNEFVFSTIDYVTGVVERGAERTEIRQYLIDAKTQFTRISD